MLKTSKSSQKLKGFMKEPNKFHNCETEKITRIASDAAENMQLRVVQFFRLRTSCRMLLMLFSECLPIYASCMMISLLQAFCRVTGFTSDFLGWNNRTTRYNRFCRAGCSRLEYIDIRSVY